MNSEILKALDANRVTARATGEGKFQQLVRLAEHTLVADEPEAFGGLGAGPSPYDLLAAGLAACTSMTIRLYAVSKLPGLPGFSIEVTHARIHANDCASCLDNAAAMIDQFRLLIVLDSPVDEDVRAKLLEIAEKCPVHRTLSARSDIVSEIVVATDG